MALTTKSTPAKRPWLRYKMLRARSGRAMSAVRIRCLMTPLPVDFPIAAKLGASQSETSLASAVLLYRRFQEFAIEIRHPSWLHDEFYRLLSRHGFSFVLADSGNRFPYHEVVTADFVYLRFHGPAKLYASDYDPSCLRNYAEKIITWLDSGVEVWAFFNNDLGGYAVGNAISLYRMVQFL